MDIWNPNWTVVKSLFWYHDQILDRNYWIHVLIRLYLTQHGHHCGLIWLNIGNLLNTPHISKLKTVLWKYFTLSKGWSQLLIVDFVGDQHRIAFEFGGLWGALTHQDGQFCPKIHKVISLCHSLDICGRNWAVVQSHFRYQGQILDKAGFLVQCGLIWLNMGINSAWFVWILAIYPTPLKFRNWKQCYENSFTLSKGRSQLLIL